MTLTYERIEAFKAILQEKYPDCWAINEHQLQMSIIKTFGPSKYFYKTIKETLLMTGLVPLTKENLYQIRERPKYTVKRKIIDDLDDIDNLNKQLMGGNKNATEQGSERRDNRDNGDSQPKEILIEVEGETP